MHQLLKRRGSYPDQHALQGSEFVCQNHFPCAQTQVFDAREAHKAVSLLETRRKGNSRIVNAVVTEISPNMPPSTVAPKIPVPTLSPTALRYLPYMYLKPRLD